MSGLGSSSTNSIGTLADRLAVARNQGVTEGLVRTLDQLVEPKISVQVLSDTLKFTIVQIILKGEIREPSLVLDLTSLIGSSAQSSIANIASNALPYLPPLVCTGGSFDNVDCSTCNQKNIGSYGDTVTQSNVCIQNPFLQESTPNQGDGSPLPNDCVNCLTLSVSRACEPLLLNNWDIIGFSPPENWYRSDPAQLGVPLISGIGNNYSKITYAIAETDNLTDILDTLAETDVYGYSGKWVPEGSCQYRFYITGVDIVQLQTVQLLNQLRNYPNIIVNDDIGNFSAEKQGFYRYEVFGQTFYQVNLQQQGTSFIDLVSKLDSLDYGGYVGKWRNEQPCRFTFNATVTSLRVEVEFDVLNYQFLSNNWKVENYTYAIRLPGETERKINYIMYAKGEYQVKIGIYPTHCHLTGPYQSIQYILQTIVNPQQWFYPQTQVYSEDLWDGIILQIGEGQFYLATQQKEVIDTIILGLEDWNPSERQQYHQGSIVVEEPSTKVQPALTSAGWSLQYPKVNGRGNCYVYTKQAQLVQLSCEDKYTNIQGELDSIEEVIDTVIKPNDWEYYPIKIPSEETFQLIQLQDGKQLVRGSDKILTSLRQHTLDNTTTEISQINEERMELLVNRYPLDETVNMLMQDAWTVTGMEDGYMTVQHSRHPELYGQLYQSGESNTNIWGPADTIKYIDKLITSPDNGQALPIYSYPTGVTLAVWGLHEYGANMLSTYNERYQVIATKDETVPVISKFCQQLAKSGRGICSDQVTEREYSSVTIRAAPYSVVDQILQYTFPNSNLRWTPGLLCCERNGPCVLRLVENIGGDIIATPHFVQLAYIGSSGNSYVDGGVIINGEQIILSEYIYPIIEAYGFTYNVPNSQPQFQNNSTKPPVIGKVVGFSGLVSKGPACGSKPKVAISALAWNLSNDSSQTTDDQGNTEVETGDSFQPYAELLWENYDIIPDCQPRGDTAFIMTGTGNYAIGILGSIYGNQLTENGGQPPIPNNAEYATGNILLRTNGPIYGTITMKVYKYSGWWNIVNFFDKNTDNLQQAIQANYLMYRDWIRVMKQRFEENNFVPWLIRQEQLNRTRLRPGPWNKALIVHTVAGQIKFVLSTDSESTVKATAVKATAEQYRVQQAIQRLLTTYLNKPLGTINLGISEVGGVYTIPYSVPAGTVLPNQAMAWLPYAKKIRDQLDQLPSEFDSLKINYPELTGASNFSITTGLNSFAIDTTSTSKIKMDHNDVIGIMLSEYKLGQILIELENMMRDGLRPNQMGTAPELGGAQQQIGGINAANQSRWLETQVNRTLYGSEFPIPLLTPTNQYPYYRFTNGEPVFGFYQNAWATGVTVPLNVPPPLVLPSPDSLTNQAFSTLVERQRRTTAAGGNTTTYQR